MHIFKLEIKNTLLVEIRRLLTAPQGKSRIYFASNLSTLNMIEQFWFFSYLWKLGPAENLMYLRHGIDWLKPQCELISIKAGLEPVTDVKWYPALTSIFETTKSRFDH